MLKRENDQQQNQDTALIYFSAYIAHASLMHKAVFFYNISPAKLPPPLPPCQGTDFPVMQQTIQIFTQ